MNQTWHLLRIFYWHTDERGGYFKHNDDTLSIIRLSSRIIINDDTTLRCILSVPAEMDFVPRLIAERLLQHSLTNA